MAETVFYPDDNEQPPRPTSAPAPKRRGRPPKRPAAAVLPTQEDARQQEEMRLQARVVANATKFTTARPRAMAKAKPQVRKVAFVPKKSEAPEPSTETVPEKRPRGRPKDSLGKKKREALLLLEEEERRRHSSADV